MHSLLTLVFSSWISSSLQRFGEVTFDSLVPPEADRTTAAHTLYKLLGKKQQNNQDKMFIMLQIVIEILLIRWIEVLK